MVVLATAARNKHLVKHSVRDTFDCIERISTQTLTGKAMASLDVSSLFTNVPLMETVDYICEMIEHNNLQIGLPTPYLKELILRCTMNVNFLFNGSVYRQIDGVAMGSPLGPLLADIFMSKLENTVLREEISKFSLYVRYMDDTLVFYDSNKSLTDILEVFNSAHPSINFTYEAEQDGTIAFLDVLLTRQEDGSIQRSVFRKTTWTGQYIHFQSFVPMKIKRNLIRCLYERACKICTPESLPKELDIIRETLRQNGYPDRFIEANLNPKDSKPDYYTVPKKPIYLSLPYKGEAVCHTLRRTVSKAFNRTYNAAEVRFTFTNRPLFQPKLKDVLPCRATSMCIYRFACPCGASYVGRTTRSLSTRMAEHMPSWFLKGERKSINSSILAHLIDTGHSVDRNSAFSIIYRINQRLPRLAKLKLLSTAEAVAIHMEQPNLCVQKRFVQTLQLPWPSINPRCEDVSVSHLADHNTTHAIT